ncbi:AglZ/HisF2 family acetamidino modification protein [Fulvivirgaceae bacterium BMA10]|uniref:imidazole glycerol-phosphate synthase n=1 Tax=Splendidivirga corallicola TaxID=3051826 RepID=A0ABT8KZV3_9BACT|nr:AglZ/HisF2 family acetamidino modification protein [Fulvivirgaceae bacterium BMA10]
MRRVRVIPVLLVSNRRLIKTIKFKDEVYVGDPINAIKIFNDKEVDELLVLDISATPQARGPNMELIKDIADECFMPLGYGGGINTPEEIKSILNAGVEKVILNTSAYRKSELITQGADTFGSQSIVVSIDVRKNMFGKYVIHVNSGNDKVSVPLIEYCQNVQELGAGEIVINSINNDGIQSGYDQKLIKMVSDSVSIPVVACGGATSIDDFRDAILSSGASAVAAGSMFVFKGKHRAVLINYPAQSILENNLYSKL